MSGFKFGVVLDTMQDPVTRVAPSWEGLRRRAQAAERLGYDTVWVADELQWEMEEWPAPTGWWEGVAMVAAVAATTNTIEVGTWVLSALHRNPGLTAKTAETLNEISDGRFIFGFGSGHAGKQGEAFGFPPDYTVSRYEEALKIVMALRADGTATFDGTYHTVKDQVLEPLASGKDRPPLLLGGHGPRTMRLAIENADIWSGFATTSCQPDAFEELLHSVDETCRKSGRDPLSIERSIGVFVASPGSEPYPWLEQFDPIAGSADEIGTAFERFRELGCTRLEIMAASDPDETIEALAPVIAAMRSS